MRAALFLCVALLTVAGAIPAAARAADSPVFAVVMTRHGVRSFTHTPPAYVWPDWTPVAPGYLSAHGYRLITYMGRYYHSHFDSIGLKSACASRSMYVYADLDQRTLETGRAIIEGACGSPAALPLYHDANMGPQARDGLFDAAGRLVAAGKVDVAASRAAVAAVVPDPSATVRQNAADFATLQSLLDARCPGTCPPVIDGDSTIVAEKGLASLTGPIDMGATYAESLFLEQVQCAPELDSQKLAAAMRIHVLEYDVNARNRYNSRIRGGNIFAHIVGMLEEKAGMVHPDVAIPDISNYSVAVISGHDTQLGALGGILDAHWPLGHGLVADDMPPGGALIFTLYRSAGGTYRVRLQFAYETLAQMRHSSAMPDGIALSPVHFLGCDTDDCSVPIDRLARLAHAIAGEGFVQYDWTPASAAAANLAPLGDPSWTRCN